MGGIAGLFDFPALLSHRLVEGCLMVCLRGLGLGVLGFREARHL